VLQAVQFHRGAVQFHRGALHYHLRTSMTSCLYIRMEFNDYFVTVEVIAQLYATGDLRRFDCVLIVNNLFQSVRCVATPSNVIDQPILIGKLGITI